MYSANKRGPAIYQGSLNISARIGVPARRGSAARAEIVIWPDRLVVIPHGLFRGNFRTITVPRDEWIMVSPMHPWPWLIRLLNPMVRGKAGVVLQRRGSLWPRAVVDYQFFIASDSLSPFLQDMESAGYSVDWTPKRARIMG
jgi:hypothetical protein